MKIIASQPSAWLLLVTNLPGQNQTLRMRIWRALKGAGVGLLRDGAYLLPRTEDARRIFEEQALEIHGGGGSAYVLPFESESPTQQSAFIALFDRTQDYSRAMARLAISTSRLAQLTEAEARRQLAALGRDVTALIRTDFFPGVAYLQIQAAIADGEATLNARFAPDEPQRSHQKIPRRDRKDYRGRIWATRQHLWIDRVCSAWLIRRFIDPKARFIWLKNPKDRPKQAVGFDFNGAEFTHVDAKVTFEVLLTSFGLDRDSGLSRIAAVVHQLDVGGIPIPESAGFAAIMSGARLLRPDDDALLKSITPVLDCLYAAYGEPNANT